MKKFNIISTFLLMLLPFLSGCSKDEIIFDSELPRFELRPGYQLLEVIVPQGTLPTDKIYITGAFNGGEEAIGDPRWQLQKANDTDAKWGIYLNPADFVDGKTLADGYSFYNSQQGQERSLQNQEVSHTEAPALGGRLNVMLYRWADYFTKPVDPGEITHDGYAIFVVDNTEYDELALYAWGDAEVFGGWPGIQPTGTVQIKGVNYKYFDTGAANEGLNLNLIFNNNNNGKQLGDYNVTLDKDYYLELTPTEVRDFNPDVVTHDGYALFVVNNSGWDALYLYTWGDLNDMHGGWPGMAPTGTQTINGVEYTYFDLGAAYSDAGYTQHVILNNGNGKQVDDVVVFAIDRDVYVELSSNSAREIDPSSYTPGSGEEPEPEPTPTPEDYKIYIENNTGWSEFHVYAWGDAEIFGGWPGASASETVTLGGRSFLVFNVSGAGETENLIFNDGVNQYDAATITIDKDYYFVAGPESCEQIDPVSNEFKIYIQDNTGWPTLYVYAWGEVELFKGWPGAEASQTETVGDITYKVLTVSGNGEAANLIFHNNAGTQYDALSITVDKDYYIIADPESATLK